MQDAELWKRAEIAHNHGHHQEATSYYSQLLGSPPYFLDAHVRIASMQSLAAAGQKPALIWRVAEKSPIVRQLLSEQLFEYEISEYDPNRRFGHYYNQLAPSMVIVDWRLNEPDALNYYLKARRSGARMILVHLSDENFMDTHNLYPLFQAVYRQYAGSIVQTHTNVNLFPSAGAELRWLFDSPLPFDAVSNRRYAWTFLGDDSKNDRKEALSTFADLKEHRVFTVTDFFDSRKMPKKDYLQTLTQAVFTLCPMGYTHVETMRFWEALECGSIPLFAHRHRASYYRNHWKSHTFPMPTFTSWVEARMYAESLLGDVTKLLEVSQAIRTWWQSYKTQLANGFKASCQAVFA